MEYQRISLLLQWQKVCPLRHPLLPTPQSKADRGDYLGHYHCPKGHALDGLGSDEDVGSRVCIFPCKDSARSERAERLKCVCEKEKDDVQPTSAETNSDLQNLSERGSKGEIPVKESGWMRMTAE